MHAEVPLVFAAAADDDTGATDLAGMLADRGLRTVLVIDVPSEDRFREWARGHDAVIIGAATRALAPREAYERTRAATELISRHGARIIEIKYCSTFDSTPEGNIGPSIDAAMDELGERFTVALPALPVNGRTTFLGYHFVNGRLLSESPMRNHPLTPMTNPNLVSHLAAQTRRKVGLAAHPVSRERLARVRANGVEIAILDCIDNDDLERVCEAISDLRLITGSSAPAMALPAIWRRNGWWKPAERAWSLPPVTGRGVLVVAGSCSEATRRQNACLEARGVATIELDAIDLAGGSEDEAAVERAAAELRAGSTCLVRTASGPDDVERVRAWTRAGNRASNEVGLAVTRSLGAVVRQIVDRAQPGALIVAGGETAGAVCRALELGALEVGPNIEPGVPVCASLGRFQMPVALKSGNFGSDDFYLRAIAAAGF